MYQQTHSNSNLISNINFNAFSMLVENKRVTNFFTLARLFRMMKKNVVPPLDASLIVDDS